MGGYKTWTAAIGYGVLEVAKLVWPQYGDGLEAAQQALLVPLGIVGLGHKIEKNGLTRF